MNQAARHDSYLGFLTRAVRRHVFLVLVVLLVGDAVAVGYVHVTPARYTATATVLPRPLIGNPLGPDISASNGTQLTVAMMTEAGLVDTPAVGELASTSLGTTVPRPSDTVVAVVPPNTQIIKIIYRSNSALHAQQGAEAMARAFLDHREDVGLSAQRVSLDSLERQAEIARASFKRATEQVVPESDPRSYASQRQLLYSNQLATLLNRISSTNALSTNPGVVARSPSLPTTADGLPPYVIVVAGVLLALVLALVLAAARERRRDLVDSVMEHDVCGLPLLADLPPVAAGAPAILTDYGPADALPDAYRRMRAGFIAVTSELKVFSIAGVSPVAVSGPVAANLGISLAQAGFRVTVVASDASDRVCERALGVTSSPGLAEVLLDHAKVSEALQDIHGIRYLSAGHETAKARELYAGPGLAAVMKKLRLDSDFVIVASGEATTSDAESVALACEAVLLLVSQGVTTHADTADTIDRYEQLHVATVGVVSLPADGRDDGLAGSPVVGEPDGGAPDRGLARWGRKRRRPSTPGLGTDG